VSDRVETIYNEARSLPHNRRSAYLIEACGHDLALRSTVDALLEADADTADSLGISGAEANQTLISPASPRGQSEQRGQEIGRYKLLEPLGEGGFGTVWAAEQREPVKRRVALKIIKLGMDTKQVIARFEAERQALAMMDHPHIAKVLDAGATSTGRPYFAMELVKGVPIIEYCDREKLDTKARLDLFTRVCHAIQHAHQKGIIHRDIKPSNVLVTLHDGKPVPKVIDFGIAKATNQELTERTIYTLHRQMIGTPEYMSPEQAEMTGLDIDTRSDIYSLGVLLYEMLTGTTPFSQEQLNSAGFEGMMKLIREVEPHKPSTRLSSLGDTGTRTALQRRTADVKKLGLILKGDLDWIVMKCLEKDRTRRYETANGLAADIERHLSDEPVLASPPSASYKLHKFVKRNKGQVLAAGAIAALLVLGVVGTTYSLVWALDEKQRADEQASVATSAADAERNAKFEAEENARRAAAAEAEALARAQELELVAEFQAGQLSAIQPEAMGANLRKSLLDAAPEAERDTLATAIAPINFTSLALTTLQENIFQRTIDAIDAQFESQPLVRARLLQTMAITLRELGLLNNAADPQERALAIRREHLGNDHEDTLTSVNSMGVLFDAKGKPAEAEPFYRESFEGTRRLLRNDHPNVLTSIYNLGGVLHAQGKFAEAESYYREALEGRRRVLGDDDPDTLTSTNSMGALLQTQGKHDEAEPYYREALERRRRVLGHDHPDTLISVNRMGALLRAMGKLAEAEPYYRDALERRRRVLGNDHPSTLTSINNMGVLLKEQGKPAEAEAYYRETLDGSRRVLGDDHPETLSSILNMGSLFQSQGKLAEAETYYRESLEGRRRVLGDDHRETLITINNFGVLLRDMGRLDEANTLGDEVVRRGRDALGDQQWLFGALLSQHARTLAAMGRYGDAQDRALEAYAVLNRTLGERHDRTRGVAKVVSDIYASWHEADPNAGHKAKAEEWGAKHKEAAEKGGGS
jgi:eukaryotic-like serine/threonine-protein kinase